LPGTAAGAEELERSSTTRTIPAPIAAAASVISASVTGRARFRGPAPGPPRGMADAASGPPGPPPPVESPAWPGDSSSSGQRSSGHSPSGSSPGRSSPGRSPLAGSPGDRAPSDRSSPGRSSPGRSPLAGSPGDRAPSDRSSPGRSSPGRSPLPGSPGHRAPSGPVGAEGRCDMDASPASHGHRSLDWAPRRRPRMARRGPPAGFMITEYPRQMRPGMFRDHETAEGITPAGAGVPSASQAAAPRVASRLHQLALWPTRMTTPEPSRLVRPLAMLMGPADVTAVQPSAA
jgi:hypothetical protein